MNYKEAVNYIDNELNSGCNPGLKRIYRLLDLIGNPQRVIKIVHIAGTNGKGSVSAMVTAIVAKAGYKVGTYNSPHLVSIRERFLINNKAISENNFIKYVKILKEKIEFLKRVGEEIPTQFEVLTALAYMYFRDEKIDIGVIEVGLGGRYDATNVIEEPMVSIITSIDYDHMGVLGEAIEQISYEKAGIIKKNGITVLYPQKYNESEKIIESISKELNNKIIRIKKENIHAKDFSLSGQLFSYHYDGKEYKDLKLPLLGDHQLINAAVAITSVVILKDFAFNISDKHIKEGLEKVLWSGRLSIISKNPLIVLDGAHNESGVQVLALALKKYFKNKDLILIMAMLKDKDHKKSLQIIAPMAKLFIATEVESERALKAEDLYLEAKNYSSNATFTSSLENALKIATSKYTEESVICIAGSLYLIGQAYKLLN